MMMFAAKMSWRYIKEQKRHSLLTVCSIAAALALITMLFTGFYTVCSCARDISYGQQPYHIQISGLTQAEVQNVQSFVDGKAEISVTEAEDGSLTARLYFTEYIGESMFNEVGYLQKLIKYLDSQSARYDSNSTLVLLDMVDLDGRARLAVIFAVFFIFVCFFAVMLRLIIDSAFEISSRERERQFGVLQSVGAAPGQIVKIITVEGLILSAVGVPIGCLAGVGLGYGAYRAVVGTGFLFTPRQMEYVGFHVSPVFTLISAVVGLAWVMFSAYGTGMRVIKMTPVEAINGKSSAVTKIGRHSLFGAIFGWKGKLASRNNFRQKKRFIITVLAITLSIVDIAGARSILGFADIFIDEVSDDYSTGSAFETGADFYVGFKADDINGSYRDGLEALESCPYLKNVAFDEMTFGTIQDENGEMIGNVFLIYTNPASYDIFFDGAPPMTYEELSESGGHIMLCNEDYSFMYGSHSPDDEKIMAEIRAEGKVTLKLYGLEATSIEEYEALSEEEKDWYSEYFNSEDNVLFYVIGSTRDGELDIVTESVYTAKAQEQYSSGVTLVGTLDTYDRMGKYFGSENLYGSYYCNITDDEHYEDALEFIEKDPRFTLAFNFYAARRRVEAIKAAIRIAFIFLAAVLAVIAVVNMVNIISTGILNRKGELAAMRCAGMTTGQLLAMTVMECLEYALIAGILAAALMALLLFGTERFVFGMDAEEMVYIAKMVDYPGTMMKTLVGTLIAFGIALAASVVPLLTMRNKPLVDMIRKVE